MKNLQRARQTTPVKSTPATERAGGRRVKWQRPFIICLSLLLLLTIALTVLFAFVLPATRPLSFRGLHITSGMYAYWQARYRYEYILSCPSHLAADTDEFWDTVMDTETGRTYRADCAALTDKLIARTMIASWLYDDSGYTVTAAQQSAAQKYLDDVLTYAFGGDEDAFNAAAEKYGFALRDARKAAYFEYKAELLGNYATATDEQIYTYFANSYIRVKMVFISSDAPAAAQNAAYLRGSLAAGADSTVFDRFVSDTVYNADPGSVTYTDGYYFAPNAAFTVEYTGYLPEVTEAALALPSAGSYTEVAGDDGIRFIYRYELDAAAVGNEINTPFFTDLSHDAALYYFPQWLDSYLAQVAWNEEAKPVIPASGPASDLYLFFR